MNFYRFVALSPRKSQGLWDNQHSIYGSRNSICLVHSFWFWMIFVVFLVFLIGVAQRLQGSRLLKLFKSFRCVANLFCLCCITDVARCMTSDSRTLPQSPNFFGALVKGEAIVVRAFGDFCDEGSNFRLAVASQASVHTTPSCFPTHSANSQHNYTKLRLWLSWRTPWRFCMQRDTSTWLQALARKRLQVQLWPCDFEWPGMKSFELVNMRFFLPELYKYLVLPSVCGMILLLMYGLRDVLGVSTLSFWIFERFWIILMFVSG